MNVDLTGIAVAIVSGVFSLLGLFITTEITARAKDKQAATILDSAVQNALGAIQQATTSAVKDIHPQAQLPGVPAELSAGVQYVLDHAGDEAARFGLTPQLIAEKISAQIGLRSLSIADAHDATLGTRPAVAPVMRPQPGP